MDTIRITENQIEQHLRSTGAVTIGDTERLAGIDTCNHAERLALWMPFAHLRSTRQPGEMTDPQCAAVMRHCRKLTARMVNKGLLSLYKRNQA